MRSALFLCALRRLRFFLRAPLRCGRTSTPPHEACGGDPGQVGLVMDAVQLFPQPVAKGATRLGHPAVRPSEWCVVIFCFSRRTTIVRVRGLRTLAMVARSKQELRIFLERYLDD